MRTNNPVRTESAFFLTIASSQPRLMTEIEYGDNHAWYDGEIGHKIGYNFDPDEPLH